MDGGQHSDACEPESGSTNCEGLLPDLLPVPGATTVTRDYSPDALLTDVTITDPGGDVNTYSLLWDTAPLIPQVVSITHNGDTSHIVYGPTRTFAVEGTTATGFGYSILGDVTSGNHVVAGGYAPYGSPDASELSVGFGYRGELHVGDLIYLRHRDLDPTLGRFITTDPLGGVPGTTTFASQYHYAHNNPIGLTDRNGLRPEDDAFPGVRSASVTSH